MALFGCSCAGFTRAAVCVCCAGDRRTRPQLRDTDLAAGDRGASKSCGAAASCATRLHTAASLWGLGTATVGSTVFVGAARAARLVGSGYLVHAVGLVADAAVSAVSAGFAALLKRVGGADGLLVVGVKTLVKRAEAANAEVHDGVGFLAVTEANAVSHFVSDNVGEVDLLLGYRRKTPAKRHGTWVEVDVAVTEGAAAVGYRK